jgi:ankyrin repeat protein
MADLLLARGADLKAKSDDGKTPADVAGERGHPELAERLRVF